MIVRVPKSVDKQLNRLQNRTKLLILTHAKSLAKNPRPLSSKKLASRQKNEYRLRVGDYRVIYSVNSHKKEIIILSVAHRKEAYRR